MSNNKGAETETPALHLHERTKQHYAHDSVTGLGVSGIHSRIGTVQLPV